LVHDLFVGAEEILVLRGFVVALSITREFADLETIHFVLSWVSQSTNLGQITAELAVVWDHDGRVGEASRLNCVNGTGDIANVG
jgi:hypothetical protein